MDILVLGGSVFLGRAVVAEALAAGHRVTVFNRGVSGSGESGAEHVRGDRTVPGDVEQLTGRSFDLVIDTCGYVPADVALTARILAPSCDFYAFVSSISVYPGWPEQVDYDVRGAYEGNPDATRDDVPSHLGDAGPYGWLKAGCELAVARAFGPDRCSLLRGGLIVGPHDSAVSRLPWWLDRVNRGGEVLVPGEPDAPVSMIDARDLARFALAGASGVFETPGPTGRDTRAGLMSACLAATGSDATFTYLDNEQWLVDQGVAEWTEVPLWGPQATMPAIFVHHSSAAESAGLTWRPLAETVSDTWAWQRSVPGGWQPGASTPGLAPDREAELLAAWHTR